jgi:Ran GTPase-activating protein (RanGAP) involved in mRNA processing and transport
MDGLERNYKLKELNLSGNSLRVPSAKRISEVLLGENIKLESLILSNNYLGDQGGNMIARALALNQKIRHVDLFDNFLYDESAKQLAHSLSRNRSLKHINIGLNGCNHRYVTQVAQLAKKNVERERRNLIPRSVKEIVRLSSKAELR